MDLVQALRTALGSGPLLAGARLIASARPAAQFDACLLRHLMVLMTRRSDLSAPSPCSLHVHSPILSAPRRFRGARDCRMLVADSHATMSSVQYALEVRNIGASGAAAIPLACLNTDDPNVTGADWTSLKVVQCMPRSGAVPYSNAHMFDGYTIAYVEYNAIEVAPMALKARHARNAGAKAIIFEGSTGVDLSRAPRSIDFGQGIPAFLVSKQNGKRVMRQAGDYGYIYVTIVQQEQGAAQEKGFLSAAFDYFTGAGGDTQVPLVDSLRPHIVDNGTLLDIIASHARLEGIAAALNGFEVSPKGTAFASASCRSRDLVR